MSSSSLCHAARLPLAAVGYETAGKTRSFESRHDDAVERFDIVKRRSSQAMVEKHSEIVHVAYDSDVWVNNEVNVLE